MLFVRVTFWILHICAFVMGPNIYIINKILYLHSHFIDVIIEVVMKGLLTVYLQYIK